MTILQPRWRTANDLMIVPNDRGHGHRRVEPFSRPRRAAHEDTGSVASIDLGIDIFQQQHATVEGENLAILRTRRLSRRADIVLAALGALEAKLLRRGRIGEIHHNAAARTLADHEGLLALAARIGLGAR